MNRYPAVDEFEYDDDEVQEDDVDQEEAEAQMVQALAQVREVLGDEFTDAEIRDSLWHYYYQVDKTVNYLLKPKNDTLKKITPKKAQEPRRSLLNPCSQPLSAQDFFHDCPWLNIPLDRRGEILIESLYPRGGLLGGSSKDAPKMSKLAALAAARKKKENDNPSAESKTVSNAVSLLDKLSSKPKAEQNGAGLPQTGSAKEGPVSTGNEIPANARKYPSRQRRAITPVASPKLETEDIPDTPPVSEVILPEPPILKSPSSFAQAMLASSSPQNRPLLDSAHLSQFRLYSESNTENPFAGPSPDDIVAKAQSASKGLNRASKDSPGQKKGTKAKVLDDLTKDLEKTKIEKAPTVKSKNLDVVAEYEKLQRKKAANFVVIGHVDAGKSTLMGRLLLDLEVIDQRTIDRYRKEGERTGKASFALAWVLDEGAEERARGVTIDIAMNRFETETTAFTILDAPGHQDFVPNMIAGASQADFAVLVVDASTGSFESGLRGQTKEHALLARSIGVQRMVVAVNKLDSVEWSQERYDEISQQVSAFLTAAGFRESNISFVPCSGLTGDNITRPATADSSMWYTGSVLLAQLEDAATPRSFAIKGPLRMPISDIYSSSIQYPLSISGRLSSGSIQIGDPIVSVPSNDTSFVKAIEVDAARADWAVAGQNAILHLTQIDLSHLKAGDVICSPATPLVPRKEFVLKALAFGYVAPMFVSVIVGRLNVLGRVDKLLAILEKASGETTKKRPKIVKPGDLARLSIVIETEGELPIEKGARVVLRAEGETVATGLVE